MDKRHFVTSLRDKTRELLDNRSRKITLDDVAREAKLPRPWLKAFAEGRIDDPGVCRIQTLYEHLTGKPHKLEE